MQISKKLLIASSVVFLVSCTVQKPTAPHVDLEARAHDAIKLQVMCAAKYVDEVDDGISDAQSVALALALRCWREYQQATDALSLAYLDNDAQHRKFQERRGYTQEKIEAFLPMVMRYRASLKKK